MSEYVLYHHGVKGMKWGVRRYQNKDGSLTAAGRKRVSKQYKQAAQKVTDAWEKQYTDTYVKSYNKVADYMNKGGIDKFNAEQRKKHGDNFMDREEYISEYEALCDRKLTKYLNKSLNDFYNSNVDYKKSKALVEKYNMTAWDELARNNEAAIESVRRAIEESDGD